MFRLYTARLAPKATPSQNAAQKLSFAGKFTAWYPRQGGEFFGKLLAGHNTFIQDMPRKFDVHHARHFSLVESLTITPVFTLCMVHYFSSFCQYPGRATDVLPGLLQELTNKTATQQKWLTELENRSPVDVIAWKAFLLLSQVVLFPVWLLMSALAPQLVHATALSSDRILAVKYGALGAVPNMPAFISQTAQNYKAYLDFHENKLNLPTDFFVAVIMIMIMLFLL